MADPVSGTGFSLIEWIMGALWAILLLLVGLIAKRSNDDRQETKGALALAASKEELRSARVDSSLFVSQHQFELHRLEDRQDFGVIHSKIDLMTGDFNRKIDVAVSELNRKVDGAVRDINSRIDDNQSVILSAISNIKK